MQKLKDHTVCIWGYPYGAHTHSWIHFAFHRTFQYLGYDVTWVANARENLPPKTQKTIFISAGGDNSFLIPEQNPNWIIFDHGVSPRNGNQLIPFQVHSLSFANYPPVTPEEYWNYIRMPKIFWATDLLPHEMKFIPYHYQNAKDVRFIGSWWWDNWDALEKARVWCLLHGKNWQQEGKHVFLRYKKFVPEDVIGERSRDAYLTLSIQGKPQCETGYIPCRVFKNMSYSVLALSNNLFLANLFDEDEIVIDRHIPALLDRAEKIVKDRKVDGYTRKALEKVKNHHTYINRIEELFGYIE